MSPGRVYGGSFKATVTLVMICFVAKTLEFNTNNPLDSLNALEC